MGEGEGTTMYVRTLGTLALAFGLTAGAGTIDDQLFRAIHDGDHATVKALSAHGVNINARNSQGRTPLMQAAIFDDAACVELLLKRGAEMNAAGPDGATALVYALPDAAKVRLLLDRGADVNARLPNGKTALM